mgnify:CR=1 FL=1
METTHFSINTTRRIIYDPARVFIYGCSDCALAVEVQEQIKRAGLAAVDLSPRHCATRTPQFNPDLIAVEWEGQATCIQCADRRRTIQRQIVTVTVIYLSKI